MPPSRRRLRDPTTSQPTLDGFFVKPTPKQEAPCVADTPEIARFEEDRASIVRIEQEHHADTQTGQPMLLAGGDVLRRAALGHPREWGLPLRHQRLFKGLSHMATVPHTTTRPSMPVVVRCLEDRLFADGIQHAEMPSPNRDDDGEVTTLLVASLVRTRSGSPHPAFRIREANYVVDPTGFNWGSLAVLPTTPMPVATIATVERIARWVNTCVRAFAGTPNVSQQPIQFATPNLLPPRPGVHWGGRGGSRPIHDSISRGFRVISPPFVNNPDIDPNWINMLGYAPYDPLFDSGGREPSWASSSGGWVYVDPAQTTEARDSSPPSSQDGSTSERDPTASNMGFDAAEQRRTIYQDADTNENHQFMARVEAAYAAARLAGECCRGLSTNVDGSSRCGRYVLIHMESTVFVLDVEPLVEDTGDGFTLSPLDPDIALASFEVDAVNAAPVLQGAMRLFCQQAVDRAYQARRFVHHAVTGEADPHPGRPRRGRALSDYPALVDQLTGSAERNLDRFRVPGDCHLKKSAMGAATFVCVDRDISTAATEYGGELCVFGSPSQASMYYSTKMDSFLSATLAHLKQATGGFFGDSTPSPAVAWEAVESMVLGDGHVTCSAAESLPPNYPGPTLVDPVEDGPLGLDQRLAEEIRHWGDHVVPQGWAPPVSPAAALDELRLMQWSRCPRGRTLLAELSWDRFAVMYLSHVWRTSFELRGPNTTGHGLNTGAIYGLNAAVEPHYLEVPATWTSADAVLDCDGEKALNRPFEKQALSERTFDMWSCVREASGVAVASIQGTCTPSYVGHCLEHLLVVPTSDGTIALFDAAPSAVPTCRISPRRVPVSYGPPWQDVTGREPVRDAGSFYLHAPLARSSVPPLTTDPPSENEDIHATSSAPPTKERRQVGLGMIAASKQPKPGTASGGAGNVFRHPPGDGLEEITAIGPKPAAPNRCTAVTALPIVPPMHQSLWYTPWRRITAPTLTPVPGARAYHERSTFSVVSFFWVGTADGRVLLYRVLKKETHRIQVVDDEESQRESTEMPRSTIVVNGVPMSPESAAAAAQSQPRSFFQIWADVLSRDEEDTNGTPWTLPIANTPSPDAASRLPSSAHCCTSYSMEVVAEICVSSAAWEGIEMTKLEVSWEGGVGGSPCPTHTSFAVWASNKEGSLFRLEVALRSSHLPGSVSCDVISLEKWVGCDRARSFATDSTNALPCMTVIPKGSLLGLGPHGVGGASDAVLWSSVASGNVRVVIPTPTRFSASSMLACCVGLDTSHSLNMAVSPVWASIVRRVWEDAISTEWGPHGPSTPHKSESQKVLDMIARQFNHPTEDERTAQGKSILESTTHHVSVHHSHPHQPLLPLAETMQPDLIIGAKRDREHSATQRGTSDDDMDLLLGGNQQLHADSTSPHQHATYLDPLGDLMDYAPEHTRDTPFSSLRSGAIDLFADDEEEELEAQLFAQLKPPTVAEPFDVRSKLADADHQPAPTCQEGAPCPHASSPLVWEDGPTLTTHYATSSNSLERPVTFDFHSYETRPEDCRELRTHLLQEGLATNKDGRVPTSMLFMPRYRLLVVAFDLGNMVLFPM